LNEGTLATDGGGVAGGGVGVERALHHGVPHFGAGSVAVVAVLFSS